MSIFSGAARSAWAVAMVETRRHMRSPTFWLVALVFPLLLIAHRPTSLLNEDALRARFLDHSLTLLSAAVLLTTLMRTLAEHSTSRKAAAIDDATRLSGEAAGFWGKALGLSLVTVLLSLVLGSAILVEHYRRFGDQGGSFSVRPHITADHAESKLPVFLRHVGDDVVLDFDMDTSSGSASKLTARFQPRITITKEGWPSRGALPALLVFSDEETGWERKKTALLFEGRPTEVSVRLPKSNRPRSIQARIKSIHPAALLRIDADSLTLLGPRTSLFACVLRGALLVGVLIAVLAVWMLFFLQRWSTGVAAFASLGLWACSVMFASIGVGHLLGEGALGTTALGLARLVLPDLSAHDVSSLIPRGRSVLWWWIGQAVFRLALTGCVLGMLQAWLPKPGQFLRMALPWKPPNVVCRDSYPVTCVARRRARFSFDWLRPAALRWSLGLTAAIVALVMSAQFGLSWSTTYGEDHPNARVDAWPGAIPIRKELLWAEADALSSSGRYWELVDVFSRIARLDRSNPRIWFFQAHTMAYNIGQSERGAARRWRWYRRALVHATTGVQLHPHNWQLAFLRFNIWRDLVAADHEVDRICRRQLNHDGLYEAMAVAGELKEQFGGRPVSWSLYLGVGESIAANLAMRGDWTRATTALSICRETEAEFNRRFPEEATESAHAIWSSIATRMAAVPGVSPALDLGQFQTALTAVWQELERHLEAARQSGGSGRLDEILSDALHFRLVRLVQDLCASELNPAALRLLAQVRRIFAVTAGVDDGGSPYRNTSYVDLLTRFIQLDAELLSARAAKSDRVEELTKAWRGQLAALELQFLEVTDGRRDGFARRMRRARP